MAAAAGGEESGVEPESRVDWMPAALDLVQVCSIQLPLPTQLLLKPTPEAKRTLAAISKECLCGKEHPVSDGENVPWWRSSLSMFQEH